MYSKMEAEQVVLSIFMAYDITFKLIYKNITEIEEINFTVAYS